YRLVEVRGREHETVGACSSRTGPVGDYAGYIQLTGQPDSNGRSLRNYIEAFKYDVAGNATEIHHVAGSSGGWTRTQTFSASSNRLVSSRAGCDEEKTFEYPHDARGNILAMPHLRHMIWDYAGTMREVELNTRSNGP